MLSVTVTRKSYSQNMLLTKRMPIYTHGSRYTNTYGMTKPLSDISLDFIVMHKEASHQHHIKGKPAKRRSVVCYFEKIIEKPLLVLERGMKGILLFILASIIKLRI